MPTARKTLSSPPATGRGASVRGRTEAERAGLLLEDAPQAAGFYERAEWKLACRVAASRGMSKSHLLPRFLLHVCELALCGRADEITEQRIGTQIFNRPPDYNPGEDNIVRSYARTMRRRLEEYFAGEGSTETLRIYIPRGAYVPVFEPAIQMQEPMPAPGLALVDEDVADQNAALQSPADLNAADLHAADLNAAGRNAAGRNAAGRAGSLTGVRRFEEHDQIRVGSAARLQGRLAIALALLAGVVLGVMVASVASVAWWQARPAGLPLEEQSAAHAVWSEMFQPARNTLIVPADSGLGILENLSRRSVTVEQYASGSYLEEMARTAGIDAANFNDLRRQRYTSVVCLDIAARLARLPEYIDSRTQIRYARSVTADDIKDANTILIGSKHTNPWVALYEPAMNFSLEFKHTVDQSYVVNRSPLRGEQAQYSNGISESGDPTYGVIAYLPSLDSAGHVLIIEGLNMAATQAAADLLFNRQAIGPVLAAARRSDGGLRPFELLIRTSSVGATSPRAEILLTRMAAK